MIIHNEFQWLYRYITRVVGPGWHKDSTDGMSNCNGYIHIKAHISFNILLAYKHTYTMNFMRCGILSHINKVGLVCNKETIADLSRIMLHNLI